MVGQHGDPGRGAEPDAAYALINYVYEPENQAQITDYNNYVTPVDGVKEFSRGGIRRRRERADLPERDYTADCSTIDDPPADGVKEVEDRWQQLLSGG